MTNQTDIITFKEAKRNINKQGTKILHEIVNAYLSGSFDDPNSSSLFCGLLACICEGKVQGIFSEETANIQWSLTTEYSAQLEAIRESMMQRAIDSGKVVQGPWL